MIRRKPRNSLGTKRISAAQKMYKHTNLYKQDGEGATIVTHNVYSIFRIVIYTIND